MTSMTHGGDQGDRGQAPRRRAVQELLRPRRGVVDVRPADRAGASTGSTKRFANKEIVRDANLAAFKAGFNFGETAELFQHAFEIAPAVLPKGRYRNITGNVALAYGPAGRQPAVGPRPVPRVVPHHAGLRHPPRAVEAQVVRRAHHAGRGRDRRHRRRPRRRLRRPARPSPPPAAPGIDLKSETIGLAVSMELPLIIVDIQRGGPSTGLPTKTEQADLLHAMFGRHGEAPVPIVAARSPGHCFDAAIEAARIALKYRTPVFLLSDGYLANGAEPWRIPEVVRAARPPGGVHHRAEPRRRLLALPA